MRKWILQAAVAVVVAAGFVGCTEQPSPTYTNSAGSLAISRDDALLFAVDQDNEIVAVIDAKSEQKLADVKVGKAPERVIVSPDNTVYVSNRGSRSVSVVKSVNGSWQEAAKIDVGVEPVGLALSPDSKTLYVVNSTSLDTTEYGTLTAIDTGSNQVKWDLPVGAEPRGIALVEGGKKAVVTNYKSGDVTTVDLETPSVVKTGTSLYHDANLTKVDPSKAQVGAYVPPSTATFKARGAADVIATPDGTRVFMPVVWSRETEITAPPSVFGGYYGSGGPCNLGAIATPGIVTMKIDGEGQPQPAVDDLTACSFSTNSDDKDFPPTTMGTITPGDAVQGPTAAVVDPTGQFVYVVNRESNNVQIMPVATRMGDGVDQFSTKGSTATDQISVGAGPNGIALSRDGKRAYVYSQFDHQLTRLEGYSSGDKAYVKVASTITVAQDTLSADVVQGRKAFYSAVDSRMTNPSTGVACSTCHADVREDGHVWVFPDGPRQTPSLAGRKLSQTAPYHWSGEFATIQDFMDHTVRLRMGGTETNAPQLVGQVMAFIDTVPTPDNPYKKNELTQQQLHGAQVFQQANCSSCHSGETLTNNQNFDVGTLVTVKTSTTPFLDDTTTVKALNVPSLIGLARTAPYLHDGAALSLKARLQNNPSDKHGITSTLSAQDMDDLVAYLNTL